MIEQCTHHIIARCIYTWLVDRTMYQPNNSPVHLCPGLMIEQESILGLKAFPEKHSFEIVLQLH
jgi:hypothetical protein